MWMRYVFLLPLVCGVFAGEKVSWWKESSSNSSVRVSQSSAKETQAIKTASSFAAKSELGETQASYWSSFEKKMTSWHSATEVKFAKSFDQMERLEEKLLHSFAILNQRSAMLEYQLHQMREAYGLYFMQPDLGRNRSIVVARDLTDNHGFGAHWTVFQRRFNGSLSFNRNWTEYRRGFGDLRGEHWLGLDNLHEILRSKPHQLLIVMEDFDGVVAYAHYSHFQIGGESEQYAITSLGQYSGTAGDSFSQHKNERFSTHDRDNDKHSGNCAQWTRGGWWFFKCHQSHLNGQYLRGITDQQSGITWNRFRGSYYSLKRTKMMIRADCETAKSFQPS